MMKNTPNRFIYAKVFEYQGRHSYDTYFEVYNTHHRNTESEVCMYVYFIAVQLDAHIWKSLFEHCNFDVQRIHMYINGNLQQRTLVKLHNKVTASSLKVLVNVTTVNWEIFVLEIFLVKIFSYTSRPYEIILTMKNFQ